jgi:uncharacterized membrane protein YdjX (TVP38/TMEM64 family)
LIAVSLAAALVLPVGGPLLTLVEWIRGAGALGVLVFALAYVLATLLLLPGSLLTASAGFTFGPALGTLVVSPVSALAATLAFLLGRSVARDWVTRRIASHPRFAAIDRATGESGFKIVFLLRLSPIFPFTLLNYALGLTSVRTRDYVAASVLGMLPATFVYVYLGSLVTGAGQLLHGPQASGGFGGRLLQALGLLATAVAVTVITRAARKTLRRSLAETPARQ